MRRSARAWVAGPALLAAWVVLGFFFDTKLGSAAWLPEGAVILAALAPAAWIIVYTVQGLAGAGKWWQSDLGTNMVWMEAALVCTNGILFWALLFSHGSISAPGISWAYIGGLLAGAIIITWRSVIWLRTYRHEPPLLARVRALENERDALLERLGERGLTVP